MLFPFFKAPVNYPEHTSLFMCLELPWRCCCWVIGCMWPRPHWENSRFFLYKHSQVLIENAPLLANEHDSLGSPPHHYDVSSEWKEAVPPSNPLVCDTLVLWRPWWFCVLALSPSNSLCDFGWVTSFHVPWSQSDSPHLWHEEEPEVPNQNVFTRNADFQTFPIKADVLTVVSDWENTAWS